MASEIDVVWLYLTLPAAFMWLGMLVAPWRPWSTREQLDAEVSHAHETLYDVTALVPARNEADTIGECIANLREQGGKLRIVVVDDDSEDQTARLARNADHELTVLQGKALPPGWAGKLWALQQGLPHVQTPLLLLIDADIRLEAGMLRTMKTQIRNRRLHFLSLMAQLPMRGLWEKLLVPAFVYFFKLLYPFHLSNSPRSPVAAAAGGCILMERRVLEEIGGFESIKDALIDDCALASRVKRAGFSTYMGLTRSVTSIRAYPNLASIWNMVARSAFTQLRYSTLLLTACTALFVAAFWIPVATLLLGGDAARSVALTALLAMMLSYLPVLMYYGRSSLWSLAMPAIGTLYLAMTWSSALRYWRGTRSQWKNRVYSARKPNA